MSESELVSKLLEASPTTAVNNDSEDMHIDILHDSVTNESDGKFNELLRFKLI